MYTLMYDGLNSKFLCTGVPRDRNDQDDFGFGVFWNQLFWYGGYSTISMKVVRFATGSSCSRTTISSVKAFVACLQHWKQSVVKKESLQKYYEKIWTKKSFTCAGPMLSWNVIYSYAKNTTLREMVKKALLSPAAGDS